MRYFPARYTRFVLFLLIVAAPVSATIALERAAQASPPAGVELRGRAPATEGSISTGAYAGTQKRTNGSQSAK